MYGFVFLLSGVYAAMRSSEMWSDCMGIISTTLRACHHAEQILGWPFKFTLSSPLWNNPCLMSGGRPFTSTTWSSSKGIHMMLVIMAPDAHSKTFKFNIHYQAHLTFFFIFSWDRQCGHVEYRGIHDTITPLSIHISPNDSSSGRVTKLYSIVVVSSMKALPIVSVWERDLGLMSVQPDWEDIWSHLAHQLILYKRMHGSYTTPYSHFKMNLSSAKTP